MDDAYTNQIERRLDDLDRRLQQIEQLLKQRPSPEPPAPLKAVPAGPPSLPLFESVSRPVTPQPAPVAAAPAQTAPTAPSPAVPTGPALPAWSFDDLERLLSGRGLAWAGGLAILLGAVFFLGLAFTRGWIGPGARVGIGLLAGAALTLGGAWFFERRERLFGHVLVAVGIGVMGLSLFAATRLYSLLPIPAGLLLSLVLALAAAAIAVRADAQVVAGYGIVAALAAPPLFGAAPDLLTIAFLATLLVGTTAIALLRSWSWLPAAAFFLAAPQLASWLLDGPSLVVGMAALAGFWTLNAVAAGGEEFRRRRRMLSPTSASIMLANAALVVWLGLALLDQAGVANGRGPFLLVVAAAHWLLGGYFLWRDGDTHPFGLLAAGTGVAALTMAVPIQLGARLVPIAWAAEAVALAWIYDRRAHGYSGAVALILATLTFAHIALDEYPFYDIGTPPAGAVPYVNAQGGTLAFVLLALLAAAALVRARHVRRGLAVAGAGLVAYTAPFELRPAVVVVLWSALALALVALARRDRPGEWLYARAAGLLMLLALLLVTGEVAPTERLAVRSSFEINHPLLWSGATAALGAMAAMLAASALLYRGHPAARWLAVGAGALLVYLLSIGVVDEFQRYVRDETSALVLGRQAQVAVSILWAAIGGAAFVAGVVRWRATLRGFGLGLLALATIKVFFYDLAALDATYKVASFIGLGILLLISSFAYQRLRPRTT